MKRTAQTVEQAPVNNALLNVVTPMGLSFEKNCLSIGENIGKAYGIRSEEHTSELQSPQ